HTDAFAPESVFGVISGATNGTTALMGGRYMVVCKSPVYDGWNDANSGGTFGPSLRSAGFDGVFVKGVAEKPVYLFLKEGTCEIRDASKYWGKTISECEAFASEEIGEKRLGSCWIGPAGEMKGYIAAVMNDTHRAAGRGGVGAVMGSKMLKGIVVAGNFKLEKADPDTLRALNKQVMTWQKEGPVKPACDMFSAYGTGADYENALGRGDAGVKNWAGSVEDVAPEDRDAISAQKMDPTYRRKKYACHSCPIGCGAVYEFDAYGYKSDDTGRPEYETTAGLGCMLLNTDADAVNAVNYLFNEYGIDTISGSGTIAWAMECYTRGLLTIDDLDGIDLGWGNAEAIVKIAEKMVHGEGVGAVLLNGSRYAADHFGVGHDALATANGIELAQHDSRFGPALGRIYVYDPSPGRHVKGGLGIASGRKPPEVKYVYDDKGADDAAGACAKEMSNCGGYCDFSGFGLPPDFQRQLLNAASGFELTPEEFMLAGKRIWFMRQAFNIREGYLRDYWYLDDRMLGKPPLEEGPLKGVTIDVETMGDEFFKHMGIDPKTGIPLRESLEEVGGMDDVIADIYG
ncbi:MAG: aldehyde ferredoxin oxidoreductase C-terminal domain-containing protein, partial [Eggerthellaceae bacterium]|nr:aldehyde ferredoxin oxidoreductase C-terminal domain-containing protein [Eggerthellaceae bacterium]